MQMPPVDAAVIRRREEIARSLRVLVPDGVIADPNETVAYACDGLTAYRQSPLLVVLPRTTEQVATVLRYCRDEGLGVVPRGAGTSLSGGALPVADGIVLGLARLNQILEVDYLNACVVAQPGVTNLAISEAVKARGFFYAPDPSSQIACTIGGNVAENSGGVHCLKYGLTANNILGVTLVLPDGEILRLGGKGLDAAGLDLLGVVIGSEGLLGIVTEVVARLRPLPRAHEALLLGFGAVEAAAQCVGRIIGAGIIPAGLEMMDRLAIEAAEAFVEAGYPPDAEALLLVELDGVEDEVTALVRRVEALAQGCAATSVRASRSEDERIRFWAGRKAAFPAVGRMSPDYYCMDGTIPRRTLPEVLRRMAQMSDSYGLRVANVFHAGDGNLHPLILYDANEAGAFDRAEAFGADILRLCVEVGGVLTGEHGVGVEKRDLMEVQFTAVDLAQQRGLKRAFDPQAILNPGKVFPLLCRCAEGGRMHVRNGELAFPDLPRF